MKKINEMTDQEILSLTDAEVDKMIRFRLMEEGIAMIERPVEPEYESYEGIIEAYSLSMLSFIVFEDERDAAKVLNVLNECESMVRTTSDWGLGEKVIYREVSNMNNNVSTERVSLIKKDDYSKAIRVKEKNDAVKEKYKAQMEVYAQYYGKWMNYTAEIYNIINDVRAKYSRMDDLTRYFAADYYPLSDNDEEKAMKYMKLAYTISEEQEQYIKDNYKERLN